MHKNVHKINENQSKSGKFWSKLIFSKNLSGVNFTQNPLWCTPGSKIHIFLDNERYKTLFEVFLMAKWCYQYHLDRKIALVLFNHLF